MIQPISALDIRLFSVDPGRFKMYMRRRKRMPMIEFDAFYQSIEVLFVFYFYWFQKKFTNLRTEE